MLKKLIAVKMHFLVVLLLFLSGNTSVFSEIAAPEVKLRCYSGSPLLVDIFLDDPEAVLKSVIVDTPVSRFFYSPGKSEKNTYDFKVTPFQKPGVYDLTLIIETSHDIYKRLYSIGFTDFRWGRDNFSFANLGETPDSKKYFSDLLFSWAEDRFGKINDREKIILLYYLYLMFGDRTGNCYAFSGSQVRYRLYPELLPSWYESVYSIRESSRIIQKEMNYYQKDMAFHNYIHKGIDYNADQSFPELVNELDKIFSSIRDGIPAVTGYLGGNEHHSMVVYGFIKDNEKNIINLIAANNWEDKADTNTLSKDAENILVYLDYEKEEKSIEWLDNYGRIESRPEKIFTLDIQKEYSHDREIFQKFVQENLDNLFLSQESIIIAEQAGDIYLVDESGSKTGIINRRIFREAENIVFQTIDQNYLFRFPSGKEYSLLFSIEDCSEESDQQFSIFYLSPPAVKIDSFNTAVYKDIKIKCSETAEAVIKEGKLYPQYSQ